MQLDVWQMCLLTMTTDARMQPACIRELYYSGMLPADIAGATDLDNQIIQDSILGKR